MSAHTYVLDSTDEALDSTDSRNRRILEENRLNRMEFGDAKEHSMDDVWTENWQKDLHPLLFRFVSGWWKISSFLAAYAEQQQKRKDSL